MTTANEHTLAHQVSDHADDCACCKDKETLPVRPDAKVQDPQIIGRADDIPVGWFPGFPQA